MASKFIEDDCGCIAQRDTKTGQLQLAELCSVHWQTHVEIRAELLKRGHKLAEPTVIPVKLKKPTGVLS